MLESNGLTFNPGWDQAGEPLAEWQDVRSIQSELAGQGIAIEESGDETGTGPAWFVIQDSRSYQSVSQTPWATPLVYPQTAWLLGLGTFGLLAVGIAAYATYLLVTGRTDALIRMLHPRSTREELKEELDDLQHRSNAADVSGTPAAPSTQTAGAA